MSDSRPGPSLVARSRQCKLDKKRWKACTSPHKVKTSTLAVGKHKLKVRAVLNGVVDASPSKATFKVRKGPARRGGVPAS